MVARHSNPPASNSGSTTSKRGPRGHEDGGLGGGEERANGENGKGASHAEETSDVDELVDSESERAEMDQIARTKAAAAGRGGAGRARGRGSGGSGARGGSSARRQGVQRSSSHSAKGSPRVSNSELESAAGHVAGKTSSLGQGGEREAPSESGGATATAPPSSSKLPPHSSDPSRGQHSPKELLGRTATGGPVPYYYPQPNVALGRSSQSPRDGPIGKAAGPSSSLSSTSYNPEAGRTGASTTLTSEDLNPQEVDKFLDLIEKHNLHTSNEDDMARSVTELYQEWLEWCAKRNVVSTKSKQALVAEFVRIHHGAYGITRQQRAMEIVQGSRDGALDGESSGKGPEQQNQRRRRSVPSLLIPPKAGPTSRVASASSIYKEEEADRSAANATGSGQKRADGLGPSSHFMQVPSPSFAPRSVTPGRSTYNDSLSAPSAAQMDSLHRRIRDDLWQEAGAMISQTVNEQMVEVLGENSALRSRVEQLEVHSDNLAQWIQHLSRVQDDLAFHLRSTSGGAPPPPVMREEVMVEDPGARFNRSTGNHFPRPMHNASPYPVGGTASTHSSPRRTFAIRRSPSPAIHQQSVPLPPGGRLHGGPVGPAPSALPPPHPQYLGQATSAYRDHPRDQRDVMYNNQGGHYVKAMSPPSHYDRPHYAYPPDGREPPLPPPLPHSPRQAKRSRNGY